MLSRAGAAALALAGALALSACGGGGSQGGSWEDGADGVAQAIAAADCPPAYQAIVTQEHSGGAVEEALAGRFDLAGTEVELEVPVDWGKDPDESAAFRSRLNNMTWLDPLLYAHQEHGHARALEAALGYVEDWIGSNPIDDPPSDRTWSDKVVGDRAPYFAYTVRAAECEGLIDDAERRALAASLAEHAEFLLDEQNRPPNNNHGLFVDVGLIMLANQLEELEGQEQWREIGHDRFHETFSNRIRGEEAFWLEHSSGYQLALRRLLENFTEAMGDDAEAEETLERMRETAAWLFRPDGQITLLGDTNLTEVPPDVVPYFEEAEGLNFLGRSGLAMVRDDPSYLLTAATYFNITHKHADELTFDLYEGEPVVTDTGRYHMDRDEIWAFQNSARAHNVLTVDDEEPLVRDDLTKQGGDTYGSGIISRGEADGWFAIMGTNPVLDARYEAMHHRLWLFRPGEALIVVDRVRSGEERTYRRHFHLAPQIRARPAGDVLRLAGEQLVGTLAVDGEPEILRGERDPLQGWEFPDQRTAVPRTTLIYTDVTDSADLVAAFGLDGTEPIEAAVVESAPGLTVVELTRDGETERIAIERDGEELELGFGG